MVGIGGIGMSGLAQMLAGQGKQVSGSDREESPTTELLAKKGIPVSIGHDGCLIPADTELLIYSDAVWPDNPERMHGKDMGVREISYYEALGEVSKGMRTIAVGGTHGKTTTTGMLATILSDAGTSPTAIVGSIVKDFGSNFLSSSKSDFQTDCKSDLLVVEACEYKDHILKLSPEILVITNIEYDHTDFFPSLAAVQETFRKAAEAVPRNGVIVANLEDANVVPVLKNARARIVDYGKKAVGSLQLNGEFNRENARAALAGALAAVPSLSLEAAVHSLSQFKGSWRRFEYKGKTAEGALVYDDYAHHPTAIRKTIEAAREKFPGKKIVVAFHPHLYSRTRDLKAGFAEALALADESFIAPIYAAREKADPEVSSEALAAAVRAEGGNSTALDFVGIRDALSKYGDDTVVFTMGAGDIYKVAEQLTDE